MVISNMVVKQNGHTYMIYTPMGEPIGMLFMGYDGQYADDALALSKICRELAIRWKVIPPRQVRQARQVKQG